MNFDACILVYAALKWGLLHNSQHASLSRQTESLSKQTVRQIEWRYCRIWLKAKERDILRVIDEWWQMWWLPVTDTTPPPLLLCSANQVNLLSRLFLFKQDWTLERGFTRTGGDGGKVLFVWQVAVRISKLMLVLAMHRNNDNGFVQELTVFS